LIRDVAPAGTAAQIESSQAAARAVLSVLVILLPKRLDCSFRSETRASRGRAANPLTQRGFLLERVPAAGWGGRLLLAGAAIPAGLFTCG
jgi:hypothetical protein